MPQFDLCFKAETEGITSVEPQQDRIWTFDARCSRCGEETQKPLQLDPREEMELPTGGGTVHMVAKCWREDEPEPQLQTVGTLECRGCEPTQFYVGDDWTVTAESGTSWENIPLTDGEWADYDDKTDTSTSIMNIETEVRIHKGGGKKK